MATSSGRKGEPLSREQLQRMEQNRRKAQEKLSLKRSGQVHLPATGQPLRIPHLDADRELQVVGPPPRKLPAYSPSTSSVSRNPPHRPQLARGRAPTHSGNPPLSSSSASKTGQQMFPQNTAEYKGKKGLVARDVANALPSAQAAPPVSAQVKFTEVRRKIKANFTLVSKSRFAVMVQYDAMLIEIFKRVPTRSYDAKTTVWSFGIEDYTQLVDVVQRECKHIQLSLVPKPVLNLFLSRLKMDRRSTAEKGSGITSNGTRSSGLCSVKGADYCSGEMDWERVDPRLASTLMQFQREGVQYCIEHEGRVLIADDMGLGKTLQAIAVMCYYRSDWPLLVICPSSVRMTWAEAFKTWVPSLPASEITVVLSSKMPAERAQVTITSYDLLVKMARELQDRKFKAVIIDESHFLKNYKTARCKAAQPIIKGAKRALLLSGTPALSRPMELYTQITAVDKMFRISLIEFGIRYCSGIKNHFGWDFSGASNMQELQLYMEERIMIRRMKSEVLDQLPSKQRQMVLLDPSMTKAKDKNQREMKQGLEKASTLKARERKDALLPLFNMTGLIKIPAIVGYVLDLLEGERKLIVFGHHRAVLDAICDSLQSKKYCYIRIDGQTPAELRQSYCDQFQHDEQCLVAVLSITTANAGLTLTAAAIVVFAELFWNPGILVQAEDRAYRIGQKSSVNIHYLVARDTVDDFIWPLIQSKLSILSQAGLAKDDFSDANSKVFKDVSQKDLMDFFSVDDKVLGGETSSPGPPAPPSSLFQQTGITAKKHYPHRTTHRTCTDASTGRPFPDTDLDFKDTRTSSLTSASLQTECNVHSTTGEKGRCKSNSRGPTVGSTAVSSEQCHESGTVELGHPSSSSVPSRGLETDVEHTRQLCLKPELEVEADKPAASLASCLVRSVHEQDSKYERLGNSENGICGYDIDFGNGHYDLDSFINFED